MKLSFTVNHSKSLTAEGYTAGEKAVAFTVLSSLIHGVWCGTNVL